MASASVVFSQEGVSVPSRTYSYSSHPRVLPVRKRYWTSTTPEISDQEGPVRYGNLMYDRRVVRGNTYGLRPLPWSSEPDLVEIQKRKEAHKKMLARKREKDELNTEIYGPQIVESKFRINVQTELYLEDIADRILEVDTECQTDEFLARPVTPLFIPEKIGVDVATQIEEGELFDFDVEVKPFLEVLVGKSIEQALLEVMEEEDLANLKAHQNAYRELRNAEMAEVQRLEEQERRHKQEKERRMMVQYEKKEGEKEVSEKVAARAFAMEYLTDLIPSAIRHLQDIGFFYDTIEREIEDEFLPYLMNKVQVNMMTKLLGRDMIERIFKQVAGRRIRTFHEYEKFRKRQTRDPFKVYDSLSTHSARRSSSTTVPGEIRLGKTQKSKTKYR